MSVVTRFAPSPTGDLHIGGARTALFNMLFARHHGGRFVLRIEDTDRRRSTPDAVAAILDGLSWLGIAWDGAPLYQSERRARHAEVVQTLLASGRAYRCFATPGELEEMRRLARAEGRTRLYDGRWRDRDPTQAPRGAPHAVRIKIPLEGESVIDDRVQGRVRVANARIDDFVLLRADGTPTYMLAVVVDDHDMGITHIIRGDDHLNNAFRQLHLFRACAWTAPEFAHIPLIHGPDGAKLSKRHGALAIKAYRDRGYLPEALRNYLLRLGWSHGDAEIISDEEAVRWFDLDAIGRAPARIDFAKLANVNGHYLRARPDADLVALVAPLIAAKLGAPLDEPARARLLAGMAGLKERAKTLEELAENALFYCRTAPLPMDGKAARALDGEARARLHAVAAILAPFSPWRAAALEARLREFCETESLKLGKVAQPLRVALTGSLASPGLFEVMAALGREETLARIAAVTGADSPGDAPADSVADLAADLAAESPGDV